MAGGMLDVGSAVKSIIINIIRVINLCGAVVPTHCR